MPTNPDPTGGSRGDYEASASQNAGLIPNLQALKEAINHLQDALARVAEVLEGTGGESEEKR